MSAARLVLRPPRLPSARARYVMVSLAAHAAVFAGIALWPGFHGGTPVPPESMVVDLVGSLSPPARSAATARQANPEPPARPKSRPSTPTPRKKEEAVRMEPEPAPPGEQETKPPPTPEPRSKPEPVESSGASRAGNPPEASGSDPGSSASGGTQAAEVQSLDLGSLEHAWYRDAVAAALRSRWIRPVLEGLREPREVEVAFEILPDGQVRDVRLARSSGVPSLDRSALRAVVEASPLPPPPRSLRSGTVPARFLFRWRPGPS